MCDRWRWLLRLPGFSHNESWLVFWQKRLVCLSLCSLLLRYKSRQHSWAQTTQSWWSRQIGYSVWHLEAILRYVREGLSSLVRLVERIVVGSKLDNCHWPSIERQMAASSEGMQAMAWRGRGLYIFTWPKLNQYWRTQNDMDSARLSKPLCKALWRLPPHNVTIVTRICMYVDMYRPTTVFLAAMKWFYYFIKLYFMYIAIQDLL